MRAISRPGSFVPCIAVLALAACGGGHGSAPDGPPANALFQDLFGAHDPGLPGASCHRGHDDCRGSTELFVCSGGTCRPCSSDLECQDEYSYFTDQGGPFVTCGADHHCHASSGDYGACTPGSPACRTADAWYPCIAGACARCATSDDCMASYGPNWLCGSSLGSPGACIESLPPGP